MIIDIMIILIIILSVIAVVAYARLGGFRKAIRHLKKNPDAKEGIIIFMGVFTVVAILAVIMAMVLPKPARAYEMLKTLPEFAYVGDV